MDKQEKVKMFKFFLDFSATTTDGEAEASFSKNTVMPIKEVNDLNILIEISNGMQFFVPLACGIIGDEKVIYKTMEVRDYAGTV